MRVHGGANPVMEDYFKAHLEIYETRGRAHAFLGEGHIFFGGKDESMNGRT